MCFIGLFCFGFLIAFFFLSFFSPYIWSFSPFYYSSWPYFHECKTKNNALLFLFLHIFILFFLLHFHFLLLEFLFILFSQLLKKWIVPIFFMSFLKYLKSPPYLPFSSSFYSSLFYSHGCKKNLTKIHYLWFWFFPSFSFYWP